MDSQSHIQTSPNELLPVSVQIQETLSGRTLVCRVQLSQDLWVFYSERDRTYWDIRFKPSVLKQQDVLFTLNIHRSHFVFGVFVQPRQITLSSPLTIVARVFFCVPHEILFHVHTFTNALVSPLWCSSCHTSDLCLTCSWLVCTWFVVCAGCTLLQRVQAEIWLLQEEVEETSKDFLFDCILIPHWLGLTLWLLVKQLLPIYNTNNSVNCN